MNISMVDIAEKLGISQSTVSLALNHSPKVSEATRLKVQAAAKEMGYQANPYVSALMTARRHGKSPKNPPVIALVTATETPDEWKEHYNTSQFIESSTRVAKSLGIRIEHFWLGDEKMTAKRLNEILFRRGIRGAILLPTGRWREKINHLWENISTVSYGIYELTPPTDWISGDYYGNMEKIGNILIEQQFKRIGFAMEIPYPYRNDNRWLAAYRMAKFEKFPEHLEPWLDPQPTLEGFRIWLEKNHPETIICVRPEIIIAWLEQLGLSVPDDISVVALGTAKNDGQYSGIVENTRTCGKIAMEMLLDRIHHSQFGQYDSPHHVTIGGQWNRGKTLRYNEA